MAAPAFTMEAASAPPAAGDAPNTANAMEEEDDALAGLYAAAMESGPGADERERSSSLWADPKMRELKHFFKSHKHENKLRSRAGLEGRSSSVPLLTPAEQAMGGRRDSTETQASEEDSDAAMKGLRNDGCEDFDAKIRMLSRSKATLPLRGRGHRTLAKYMTPTLDAKTALAQAEAENQRRKEQLRRLQELNHLDARLNWRHSMDDSLQRLLIDMELAEDDRLKEYSHTARCGHLDKIYEWYLTHGQKEARKERPGPPYVRYSINGPIMPGSLRPAPKTNEPPAATTMMAAVRRNSRSDGSVINQSASLPNLQAAGDESPGGASKKDAPQASKPPSADRTMRQEVQNSRLF